MYSMRKANKFYERLKAKQEMKKFYSDMSNVQLKNNPDNMTGNK